MKKRTFCLLIGLLALNIIGFGQRKIDTSMIEFEEISDEPFDSTQIYHIVEDMPEFKGGQGELYKYIGKNTIYPELEEEYGIQGKVYVRFVIDTSGRVTKAEILRGVSYLIDREALRVVEEMPSWKPGTQRGKKVLAQYTLPLSFKIDNVKAKTLDEEYYYRQGKLMLQNQDYIKSIKSFDQVLKLNPKYIEAYYYRALSRIKTGNDQEDVCEDLRKAVKLEHSGAKALLEKHCNK